jgi:hypothetical protein
VSLITDRQQCLCMRQVMFHHVHPTQKVTPFSLLKVESYRRHFTSPSPSRLTAGEVMGGEIGNSKLLHLPELLKLQMEVKYYKV